MSVTAQSPARPRQRRSRRWLRAAIPFFVLIAIWTCVGVAHAIEEPDLDEVGTLSPTGTSAHGSSRLAELLRARGVSIDRVTSSAQARQAAGVSASTIFVPTPDYLNVNFLADIARTPGVQRVVVVQPGLRSILFADLRVYASADRWATDTVEPGCDEASISAAGPAIVMDSAYEFDRYYEDASESMNCYHGSVVGVRWSGSETVYVGANDPFRNDRIDEVGNAELVTALLGESPRVVWVDVHTAEPLPTFTAPPVELPRYRRDDQDRTATGFPIFDAFPSWFWAGMSLALVAGLLLAVARARRLGPPVAEPLPVIVPAAEAITGRGRLYQRIAARGSTLDALRGAAIARMTRVLNPFGAPGTAFEHDPKLGRGAAGADELVHQVALRTRSSEDVVRAVLFDIQPADDAELAETVASLDALVTAVLTGDTAGHPSPQDSVNDDANQPAAPDQFRGGNP